MASILRASFAQPVGQQHFRRVHVDAAEQRRDLGVRVADVDARVAERVGEVLGISQRLEMVGKALVAALRALQELVDARAPARIGVDAHAHGGLVDLLQLQGVPFGMIVFVALYSYPPRPRPAISSVGRVSRAAIVSGERGRRRERKALPASTKRQGLTSSPTPIRGVADDAGVVAGLAREERERVVARPGAHCARDRYRAPGRAAPGRCTAGAARSEPRRSIMRSSP